MWNMQIRLRTIEEIRQFSDSKCRSVLRVLECAEHETTAKFLQFHGQFIECSSKPIHLDKEEGRGCDLPNPLYWSVIDDRVLDLFETHRDFVCCQHMLDID